MAYTVITKPSACTFSSTTFDIASIRSAWDSTLRSYPLMLGDWDIDIRLAKQVSGNSVLSDEIDPVSGQYMMACVMTFTNLKDSQYFQAYYG